MLGTLDSIPAQPTNESETVPDVNLKSSKRSKRRSSQRHIVEGYGQDDTPKAFQRLLQFKKSGHHRPGLDDGVKRGVKKQKIDHHNASKVVVPELMPGEKFSDFAIRVNQAMPISGLNQKGVKVEGVKERQTKLEKKIQKKQSVWRREDAARQEKERAERDLIEEQEAEKWTSGTGPMDYEDGSDTQEKKRRRRKANLSDDDDPWSVLKARREAPRGINDVAQEPPHLKKQKPIFKIKSGAKVDVADVPTTAGSLRKREELGNARRDIIERYRQLMHDKRSEA